MPRPWILVGLALVIATLVYAPALDRAPLDHDDAWLVRDNWIVQDASASSLHAIALDLSRPTRAVLGAEYLPVRDLSVMLDFAVWGAWWPGHRATSLALYLAACALWFVAFVAFGMRRDVAAIAIAIWTIHPTHVESVAWLSERKGVLALALVALCALAYARYRAGAHGRWLALAIVAAIAAVWSKAPAAFAIAALGALELALPARRVSWRRSIVALAAIGAATAAAFVPVTLVAVDMGVVGGGDRAPASWAAMALGTHGFYVRLAAFAVRNAVSYPIRSDGPSSLDLALGIVALAAAIAIAVAPRIGRWRPAPELRAACALWLFGWFPASRLILPLHHVLVADRYLSFATLGFALALAVGIAAFPSAWARATVLAAIAIVAGVRAFDAQTAWHDDVALWSGAVESNPNDGEAWAIYADELDRAGRSVDAQIMRRRGLSRVRGPRLLLGTAVAAYKAGDVAGARALLVEAAEGDDPYAMADLALVLWRDDRDVDRALGWARRATATGPVRAELYDVLCQIAAAAGERDEAAAACEVARRIRKP